MAPTKLVAVTFLALVGLTGATLEASFVHSDDGCPVEIHCHACLFQLRTPGVVTAEFSLPRVVVVENGVAPAPTGAPEVAARKSVPSRGPPLA